MNWFNKTLELSGYPLKKAQAYLEKIDVLVEENIEAYTTQHKQNIFQHHIKNTPFYKEFCSDKTITDWQDIPVLEKKDFQKALAERLSKGYSPNKTFHNSTSGSSGHPLRFAKDKFAHALTWAHILSLYKQYDIRVGKSLEARFYGIPKSGLLHHKEMLKDKLANRIRFDVFDLSDKNLESFLKTFRQNPFEYINGYTSSIVRFAKYLQAKNIILTEICPTLKACITTSEMLFEKDRQLLSKQFKIPIVNEYGAAELGIIAFENPNKIWELNHRTLHVEIVDDKGNTLAHNEEGHVVITSLYNKAHPFIRYKIGDFGSMSSDLVTGKPILQRLTGRTNEFAHLPSGKIVPALTFYYVTKTAIEKEGDIKELIVKHKQ